MHEIGSINNNRLIVDTNITKKPVYPTGYKDCNKLGKRKRNLTYYPFYVMNGTIFVSLHTYNKLKELK